MSQEKLKRSRATKRQIEEMLSYIESNKDMVYATATNASNFQEIERKWQALTAMLNEAGGTTKTVKQWKSVFADLKTNAKRKARSLKFEMEGIGGGPASKKPLTLIEERILGLVSKISVEGAANIEEVGYVEELIVLPFCCEGQVIEPAPSTSRIYVPEGEAISEISIVEHRIPTEVHKETAASRGRHRRRPRRTNIPTQNYLRLLAESNNNVARGLMAVARSLQMIARRRP